MGRALGGEVAFDGEGELGEVGVADDLAELGLGLEHPGGGPAQAHVTGLPALDVAAGAADGVDHRLDRVRRGQRLLQPAADPEAGEGQRLLEALAQRAGRAGVGALQLAGEGLQAVERERWLSLAHALRSRVFTAAGRVRGDDRARCVPCGGHTAAPAPGRRPR